MVVTHVSVAMSASVITLIHLSLLSLIPAIGILTAVV